MREKKVKIKDRELTLKEISFMGYLRLQKLENASAIDMYREMMSEEDFAYLDQVGKEDFERIRSVFGELVSESKKEDFQIQTDTKPT